MAVRKNADGLTELEANFVDEMVRGMASGITQTEAVRRAGYRNKRPHKVAHELMQKPHIIQAIENKVLGKSVAPEVTAAYVLRKLVRNVEEAEERGQINAAIRGLEIIGKHLGMFKEQVELTGKDGNAIEVNKRLLDDVESFKSSIASLAERGRKERAPLETKH